MKKSQIRKIILTRRKIFKSKNKKIDFYKLLKLLNRKIKNKRIGLYYPIGSEVSTIELIEKLRKKIHNFATCYRKKLQYVVL